jgi:hypothetical protein
VRAVELLAINKCDDNPAARELPRLSIVTDNPYARCNIKIWCATENNSTGKIIFSFCFCFY